MFEWNRISNKEKASVLKIEEVECEAVEEVAGENKETVVQEIAPEEHYTIYKAAEMLGISNTLFRTKLVEYKVGTEKIDGALMISRENFNKVKRYRVVDGMRKLACIEDFELCEECMERILR